MTNATLPIRKPSNLPIVAAVLLGGLGAVVAGVTVGLSQAIIAGFLICMGSVLVFTNTDVAIIFNLVYTCFMGDVRRLAMGSAGNTNNDPLIIVGPVLVGLTLLKGFTESQFTNDTRLSKTVFALMLVMFVQIFNPLQGGISVGLAGVMFYLLPLGWYWIGKSMMSAKLTRNVIFNLLVPIAALASLMGLYQTFVRFLPYQAHWATVKIHEQNYTALLVGGSLRAFGFSNSMAEYDWLMTIASVALIATLLTRRLKRTSLLLIPMLAAIFLASGRGPVVMLVGTSAVMFSAMGRSVLEGALRFALVPAVVIPLMFTGMMHLHDVEVSEQVQGLIDHQEAGLMRSEESTAAGHWERSVDGLIQGLRNPFGRGLGSTTIAGVRSMAGGGGTEVDYSDMFISLGLGGILYTLVIIFGIWCAWTHFRAARTLTALAALGILVVMVGHWIEGLMYSIPPFICLLLGSMDQRQLELELAEEAGSRRRPMPRNPARVRSEVM